MSGSAMKSFLSGILAAILSLTAAPARAEFTFKTVRPPAAGETNRINIQIEAPPPVARTPEPAEEPEVAATGQAPRTDQEAWFWSAVSPDITPEAGRFQKAAEVAARPPAGSGIAAPSLQTMRAIARAHGADILARSVGTRVSPALVLALISVESAGRPGAVSNKGATGLMQLIPATAARFGIADARDPGQNIRGGVAYLDWLMREFGDDPVLALAGYNAGEGAVQRYGGVPPFAETRAYVPKVLAAWNVARLMCRTPPQLPGDGCVFDPSLTES